MRLPSENLVEAFLFLTRDELDAASLASKVFRTAVQQQLQGHCLRKLSFAGIDVGTAQNDRQLNALVANDDGRTLTLFAPAHDELTSFLHCVLANSYIATVRFQYSVPVELFSAMKVRIRSWKCRS